MMEPNKRGNRPIAFGVVILAGIAALLFALVSSVSVGAADIDFAAVWEAVFQYNRELQQHQIIQELRFPRALAGALVGACFSVAGALMQGMTRNPLADPGLLGINAGAGFVLSLCFSLLPGLSYQHLMLFSFLGAAVGTGLVFGIGAFARNGMSPLRLVLAGAAVTALLTALSEGIALYFRVGQELDFWFAGGLSGIKRQQVSLLALWTAAGLLAAILLSRSLTILSMGEEVAAGLGQRSRLVKFACSVVVLVLAGAAVSTVGVVGFVGLIIPHIARSLVGADYRLIIPCSAVLGSLLMVVADLGARLVNPNFETPVGAVIVLLGVPFFLYLTRQQRSME
ncbi:ferrichrome ABC transporter permease [Paenibacillus darwinianus]|uniref:Ferrichrome ABC transporter permease n=1 Tax=Paenibacillus darwinianus TaxID=1380763 RepID=A0A9W5S3D1_9BACL|nr:iron ABC transporter permease [Paenibacillus darwinianus]EXX90740.1 ferrichrome ABC transporter permease [Paenibacillus darwinianus]EXX91484.1 ferrichrome ABC transporter permease [Paenibacillus darwinianus]EXX92125.1 ferrichrome ABC transporter permease [Paenibacillus darwinianus]